MSNTEKAEPSPSIDKGAARITTKDKNARKGEEERRAEPISKPGGYRNDPNDPTNPNEARERVLKELHQRDSRR